jgi:hypothetical protein
MKKVTNQVIKVMIPCKKKLKIFKSDSKKYILRNIKKSFLVEVKVPHFLEEGYRNIEISNQINKIFGKEMVKIISEKMRKDKYVRRIKL